MSAQRIFIVGCVAAIAIGGGATAKRLTTSGDSTTRPSTTLQFGTEGFRGEGATGSTDETSTAAGQDDAGAVPKRWRRAVTDAVRRANALGGRGSVAVWADDWSGPISAGWSTTPSRMWSTSKPVVAATLLGKAESDGVRLPESTLVAMRRAIQRSENCRQRHAVVALQDLAGGSSEAIVEFRKTLDAGGASDVKIAPQLAPAAGNCDAYLERQRSVLDDPFARAVQFGITTWTIREAASFMHAIGTGTYGGPGMQVLELMREPKRRSSESASASDYTPALDWGAGAEFAGMRPAYKAGWGGVQQRDFIVSQIIYVKSGSTGYAIAAAFKPSVTPPLDDPGRTIGPQAIETILSALRQEM